MKRLSLPLLPACLAGSVCASLWFSASIWMRFFTDSLYRYADSGLPMLVEGDAYYHLFHASQALAGHGGVPLLSQGGVPLLSQLGALLAKSTGFPLQGVAFWLPMMLVALIGLCVWGWGRILPLRPWQGFLASALAVTMPAVAVRIAPGRFDTDCGIVLLWHGCVVLTALCSIFSGQRFRMITALAALLAGCALGLFWTPGFALLPLCLWLWGLTYALEPRPELRGVRRALALLLPVLALVFLVLPAALLPASLFHARSFALDHLQLALGLKDRLADINELRTLSPRMFLAMLGAYSAVGLLTLGALGLAICRFPKAMLFFLPSGIALVLGFFSARFLYLAALPLALGVALLPSTLPWAFRRTASRPLMLAGSSLAVAIWGCSLLWPVLQAPPPVYNANLDNMVLALKAQARSDARLWNWWDEGYFLQARTGLTPLFHGGSQDEVSVMLAAYPLAHTNPQVSRRWMRFFAKHGLGVASTLRNAWGSWETVEHHLTQAFAADDPVSVAQGLPPVPGLDLTHAETLLPSGEVWLCLPSTFLLFADVWRKVDLAAATEPETVFLNSASKNVFQGQVVEGQPAVIDVGNGPVQVGEVINTTRTPLTMANLLRITPPYLITNDASPWWHLAGKRAAMSTAFRLLAPWGHPVPNFRQVWLHPAVGGVWEVLP